MIKLRRAIEEYNSWYDSEIDKEKNPALKKLKLLEQARWNCQNDLYALGLLTGHTKFIDPFHRDFCDMVSLMNWQIVYKGIMPKSDRMLDIDEVVDNPEELGKMQRLFLMFRSAFKTTIVTKLHTIQLLLNFPELHIAITHNTQINASDNLESVKNLFLSSKLRILYPEYLPSSKDWGNKTGFSVAKRRNYTMNGDNVEAIGIGTEVTGRKYHIFKNDDIVTEKSVTNAEQLKQSRDYLELHKSLFVNPTVRIEDYCGTKYHFADAYAKLEEDPEVQKTIIRILTEDPKGELEWANDRGENKKWRRTLPEMHTIEGIKSLMTDPYIFNCQNQLNPSNPLKIKFTREMIRTFTHIPDGLNYYLVVDPADSEEKRACYTAMKVIGVDHDDNWYWVDGVFDKLDDRERIDEAIRLAQKWKVFEVLWENISFGRTDNRNLERERRKIPNATWQVREIPASRVSKDDRILGLNDRYSRHKVFWPERMMYYSKCEGKTIDIVRAQEYEFLGFPLVSHKDLLDAESFMLQIDLIQGSAEPPPKEDDLALIEDPIVRGNTMVFRKDWEEWKANGFSSPQEVVMMDGLD